MNNLSPNPYCRELLTYDKEKDIYFLEVAGLPFREKKIFTGEKWVKVFRPTIYVREFKLFREYTR